MAQSLSLGPNDARLVQHVVSNVSDAEALDCYVAGLKSGTRDWVLIHNPNSLHKAARWAERYEKMHFSRGKANAALQQSSGNQMPVGHHQQPAAVARLTVVSLTHKATGSSLTNGSSNPRCSNDHRARIWSKIISSLKGSASMVVIPAIRLRSVN